MIKVTGAWRQGWSTEHADALSPKPLLHSGEM